MGRPSLEEERGNSPRPHPLPSEIHYTLVALRPLATAAQGWPVGLILRLPGRKVHRPPPSAIALRGCAVVAGGCAVVAGDHRAVCDDRAGCPQWGGHQAAHPLAARPARLVCVGAQWSRATTTLRAMRGRAAPNGAGNRPPTRSPPAQRALPLDLCALRAAGVPTGRAWREV